MGPDTWVPSLSLRTPDQESAEQRPSKGKGALGQLKKGLECCSRWGELRAPTGGIPGDSVPGFVGEW